MIESPFFFQREAVHLFGLLHLPEQPGSKLAFVMCHPFSEEKLWSHRVFVSTARALAAKGHIVMRFDFMGAGDSSGAIADTSLATHLADLSAAVATLLARHPEVERVGLIGLRMGATIAALFSEQAAGSALVHLRNAPLVLWDPILDGEAYFQELLRSNLSTQLAVYGKVQETREVLQEKIRAGSRVNVDGYEIAKPLFESCSRTDLLTLDNKQHAGPVLIIQIASAEGNKARQDLQQLAERYGSGTYARVTEQPFWREIKPFYGRAERLQQSTLAWLEQLHV